MLKAGIRGVCWAIGLLGCAPTQVAETESEPLGANDVARVGERVITASEIEATMRRTKGGPVETLLVLIQDDPDALSPSQQTLEKVLAQRVLKDLESEITEETLPAEDVRRLYDDNAARFVNPDGTTPSFASMEAQLRQRLLTIRRKEATEELYRELARRHPSDRNDEAIENLLRPTSP